MKNGRQDRIAETLTSSGGAYFPPEEEYAHRKEHKKTQETGMPDILLQDAANLVRSFSQSCGKFR